MRIQRSFSQFLASELCLRGLEYRNQLKKFVSILAKALKAGQKPKSFHEIMGKMEGKMLNTYTKICDSVNLRTVFYDELVAQQTEFE